VAYGKTMGPSGGHSLMRGLVLLFGFVQWNGLPVNAHASIEMPTHGIHLNFLQEEADRYAASSPVDVPVVHLKTGRPLLSSNLVPYACIHTFPPTHIIQSSS
jgi:hypothetical protein